MSDFILSCCSTADLSKEKFEEYNIHYVCFHYELNDIEYLDDLGETLSFDSFYKSLSEGSNTKTSQVSVGEYVSFFRQFAEEGKSILHVCLSSGLSGTYTSAKLAAEIIRKEFPDIRIIILDSLCASSGYGLLMISAAEQRDAGKSMEEIAGWIENNKLKLNHWFFSTDLSFYIKGGRISKTLGTISGVLGICPLLNMDNLGHLSPYAKVRTKRKVKERIVEEMVKNADGGENYSGKCYISHSACIDDAKDVKALIEERFSHLSGKVEIFDIGTTIGSHTGPGTVAIYFFGTSRVKKDTAY